MLAYRALKLKSLKALGRLQALWGLRLKCVFGGIGFQGLCVFVWDLGAGCHTAVCRV